MTMSAPDDVADAPVVVGGDRVVRVIERVLGPAISVHRGFLPEIELVGPDEASGIWAMEDVVEYPDTPERNFRGSARPTRPPTRAPPTGGRSPRSCCGVFGSTTADAGPERVRGTRYDEAAGVHLSQPGTEPQVEERPVEIESAWPTHPDYAIDLVPVAQTTRVWSGDVLLAQSTGCLRVEETRHVDRLYFPESDVDWEHFEESVAHTICRFKGEASYWTLITWRRDREERRVDLS